MSTQSEKILINSPKVTREHKSISEIGRLEWESSILNDYLALILRLWPLVVMEM